MCLNFIGIQEAMRISNAGINLIAHFEGLRLEAYRDVAGIPTIGYGHIEGVKMGDKITKETALMMLHNEVQKYSDAVDEAVKVELTQQQFDVLVSFTYNMGIHAFKTSTLLRFLNLGKYEQACDELLRWVHAGGKRIKGLVNRRMLEHKLFKNDIQDAKFQH